MKRKIIILSMVCLVFIATVTTTNAGTTVCSDSPDGNHHMEAQGMCVVKLGNETIFSFGGLYECKYCGDSIAVENTHPNYYVGKYVHGHDFTSHTYAGGVHGITISSKNDVHFSAGPLEGFEF